MFSIPVPGKGYHLTSSEQNLAAVCGCSQNASFPTASLIYIYVCMCIYICSPLEFESAKGLLGIFEGPVWEMSLFGAVSLGLCSGTRMGQKVKTHSQKHSLLQVPSKHTEWGNVIQLKDISNQSWGEEFTQFTDTIHLVASETFVVLQVKKQHSSKNEQ